MTVPHIVRHRKSGVIHVVKYSSFFGGLHFLCGCDGRTDNFEDVEGKVFPTCRICQKRLRNPTQHIHWFLRSRGLLWLLEGGPDHE